MDLVELDFLKMVVLPNHQLEITLQWRFLMNPENGMDYSVILRIDARYHIIGDYAVGEHLDNNPLVNLTQMPMGGGDGNLEVGTYPSHIHGVFQAV